MPPLPYLKSGRESMDRLVGIIQEMKRANIVAATPTYLHVEFRSALFRFADDVEFALEDSARLIPLSASRTGTGLANRRRIEISDQPTAPWRGEIPVKTFGVGDVMIPQELGRVKEISGRKDLASAMEWGLKSIHPLRQL
jgi:hypothetical protein